VSSGSKQKLLDRTRFVSACRRCLVGSQRAASHCREGYISRSQTVMGNSSTTVPNTCIFKRPKIQSSHGFPMHTVYQVWTSFACSRRT
jgi:hypothetical protein